MFVCADTKLPPLCACDAVEIIEGRTEREKAGSERRQMLMITIPKYKKERIMMVVRDSEEAGEYCSDRDVYKDASLHAIPPRP